MKREAPLLSLQLNGIPPNSYLLSEVRFAPICGTTAIQACLLYQNLGSKKISLSNWDVKKI